MLFLLSIASIHPHISGCPQGFPSFINQQCAATNNRPFNSVLYTWQEFTERDTAL